MVGVAEQTRWERCLYSFEDERMGMRKVVMWWMLFCVLVFAACARGETGGKVSTNAVLATCVLVKGCAVRFVYFPPRGLNHIPEPLILRQARRQDPHFGTWSTLMPQGVTQWISPEEMQSFLAGLEKLDLPWEVSRNPMSFRRVRKEPPVHFPMLSSRIPMSRKKGTMEIDVTSEAGSAVAFLASKKVCASMKPMVDAFRIPMAIYAFQGTLLYWGCKVPGFNLANRPAPPEHKPR